MKCNYCGEELKRTSGKMLVKNDGSKVYFCSSKCEKNWSKGRNLKYKDKER